MSSFSTQSSIKAVANAEFDKRLEPELKKLKASTDAMEATFFKQLMQTMRQSIPKVKVGDSTGADTYREMMDQALADGAGKRGALGLGDMLFKQLSGLMVSQEKAKLQRQAAFAAHRKNSETAIKESKI